jgi:Domain of unknown function (DUF4382)
MLKKFAVLVTVTLMALMVIAGCSDDDSTAPEQVPAGDGHMTLNLIDSAGPYEEVNIEVIQVSVHKAGEDSTSGWLVISNDTLAVNLLEYTNGNHAILADSSLASGQYTQVRLLLTDNNTVVVHGETHDLEIPSGSTSGLKLNHPFTIEEDVVYSATLDFDAERSIHMTGNGQYKMKPVIRIVVDATSGSIFGTVDPADARAKVMTFVGEDTVSTYADTLTGDFRLMALPAGMYDVEISATVGAYRDTVLADVQAPADGETDLGTIVLEEIE